jgi:hypothetical protein
MLVALLALSCPIRERQAPEFAALPLWPKDGKVAQALDGNLVFRDPATEEIVLAYPAEAERSGQASGLTARREHGRFYLNNRTAPLVRSAVSRNREGQFVYTYEMENCPEAVKPIHAWQVAGPRGGPREDPALQGSHPSWHPSPAIGHQVVLPSLSGGYWQFVSWYRWDNPILPGQKVGGFELISSFRPGFTTAAATGPEPGFGIPDDSSLELIDQLTPLTSVGVRERTTLTLGPRFSPQMSNLEVARAWAAETQELIVSEWLDGQSPFIGEVLTRLRAYIESGGSSPLVFQIEPQPGFETEIANAIRLSLQGGSTQ